MGWKRPIRRKSRRSKNDGTSVDAPPPISMGDLVHRILSESTADDDALRRHLEVFRFARSTLLQLVAIALGVGLIFGVGIAVAAAIAGVHIAVAAGIGAGGSATFIFVVVRTIRGLFHRRYLRAILRAVTQANPQDPQSGP